MTIRQATADDVDAMVRMGLHFQATTAYAVHLRATAATLRTLADELVASDHTALWFAERDGAALGMIAAALYRHPMSGETIGTEICWWMDPAARGGRAALRLLKTAEAWAKAAGATVFQMMAPTDDVGRLYERLGFDRIEVHYQRRIA